MCGPQELMTSWHERSTIKVCKVCVIFTWHRRTKVSSSTILKLIMLRYPTTWQDYTPRNTMSTVSWKIWSLRLSTFGVKNVPLKIPRTVPQLCRDQLCAAMMVYRLLGFTLHPALISQKFSSSLFHSMWSDLTIHITPGPLPERINWDM